MKKYKIQVTLLSDLCSSNGDGRNTSVDTEVTYDEYGIPFLPAKRMKGLLRESAMELADWGLIDQNLLVELFGVPGGSAGKMQIGSLHLQGADELKEGIGKLQTDPLYGALLHPHSILDAFTYLRSQTSLEDGVAKSGSLRVMRVVRHGLSFTGDLTLQSPAHDEDLEKITLNVQCMGLHRTRGLGRVKVTLEPSENDQKGADKAYCPKEQSKEIIEVVYELHLIEPAIMLSPARGENGTESYIPGNKMLGLLRENLSQEAFLELTRDATLKFSNAYVVLEGQRSMPVMKSMQKIKDSSEKVALNRIRKDTELDTQGGFVQLSGLGDFYFQGDYADDGVGDKVRTQISYHHRRDEDKTHGRASDDGFYQLSALRSNQRFQGFLRGEREDVLKVLDVLKPGRVRIGYNKTAEYGAMDLSFKEASPLKSVTSQDFVMHLASSVLLYDREKAMPSARVDLLINYIKEQLCLNHAKLEILDQFLSFDLIGGFQRTWGGPKPYYYALGAGSAIRFKSDVPLDLKILSRVFIGERTQEGYGEVHAYDFSTLAKKVSYEQKESASSEKLEESSPRSFFKNPVMGAVLRNHLSEHILEYVSGIPHTKALNGTSIGRLQLMSKEQPEFAGFERLVKSIKDENKSQKATSLINMNPVVEDLENYCKSKRIPQILSKDEIYRIYMPAMLAQAKYHLRAREEKKDAE